MALLAGDDAGRERIGWALAGSGRGMAQLTARDPGMRRMVEAHLGQDWATDENGCEARPISVHGVAHPAGRQQRLKGVAPRFAVGLAGRRLHVDGPLQVGQPQLQLSRERAEFVEVSGGIHRRGILTVSRRQIELLLKQQMVEPTFSILAGTQVLVSGHPALARGQDPLTQCIDLDAARYSEARVDGVQQTQQLGPARLEVSSRSGRRGMVWSGQAGQEGLGR